MIEFHPKVEADIKRKHPEIARKILDIIHNRIAPDPNIGSNLKGPLKGLRKYKFASYRIAYHVTDKSIRIIMTCNRQSFYEALERRVKRSMS